MAATIEQELQDSMDRLGQTIDARMNELRKANAALDLYRDLYLNVKTYLFWYDNRPDNWEAMYIQHMRDAVEVIEGKEPENAGR